MSVNFFEVPEIVNTKRRKVIQRMEPKIRKSINSIPVEYREDIEQDIKLKLYKSVENVDYKDIPGFFEFLELNKEG